jgi:uncharacterized protein YneF (UPF0154 family)
MGKALALALGVWIGLYLILFIIFGFCAFKDYLETVFSGNNALILLEEVEDFC